MCGAIRFKADDGISLRRGTNNMPTWLSNPLTCGFADKVFKDKTPHPAWRGHTAGLHNRIIDTCRNDVAQQVWDKRANHSSPDGILSKLTKDGLNTSLLIVGDSTSNQHFRVMACMLEDTGFKLSTPELTLKKDSCLLWKRGKQYFELCKMYSTSFPKLPINRLHAIRFRDNAMVFVEVSTHYNDNEQYRKGLQTFVSEWATLGKNAQFFVRSPLPQHFDAPTGAYDPHAGASHSECKANTEVDPKYKIFRDTLSETGLLAWDVYPSSVDFVSAHPDPSIKRDCTHFCNAVVYQWSELLAEVGKD